MRKRIIFFLTAFTLGLWHVSASAALKFGTSEQIQFVANVTLEGPKGEKLYLGRKIAHRNFLLPYAVEDQGFVLGISGESKKFFPIPEGRKLEAIQAAGYLPTPLPDFKLDNAELFFGHLLWVFLIGMGAYGSYLFIRKRWAPSAAKVSKSAGLFPEESLAHSVGGDDGIPYTGPQFTLPLKLYPSRIKMLGLLAIACAFVWIGISLVQDGQELGYVCAGFFGLGIPIFAIQLIPAGAYLEINDSHFAFVSLFKRTMVKWDEVTRFTVIRIPGNKMIGWNYSSSHSGQSGTKAFARSISGAEAALPNTYGMKAEDLSALLNEVKRRHGKPFNSPLNMDASTQRQVAALIAGGAS